MDADILLFLSSLGFEFREFHKHFNIFSKDIEGIRFNVIAISLFKDTTPRHFRLEANRKGYGIYNFAQLQQKIPAVISQITTEVHAKKAIQCSNQSTG